MGDTMARRHAGKPRGEFEHVPSAFASACYSRMTLPSPFDPIAQAQRLEHFSKKGNAERRPQRSFSAMLAAQNTKGGLDSKWAAPPATQAIPP
jgi:hypothetical protein